MLVVCEAMPWPNFSCPAQEFKTQSQRDTGSYLYAGKMVAFSISISSVEVKL